MGTSFAWGCTQNTDTDGSRDVQLVEKDVALQAVQSPAIPLSGIINETSHSGTKAFLQAMSTTFSNDPSLRAAGIRAAGFSKRAEDLRSPLRPEILADASTFEDGITVTANQPLYDFGKREARLEQVRADRLSEINSLADQKEILLRAGLYAVLDVQFGSEAIAVRNRQISDLRTALDAADNLERLGLITAADKRFAEVELQRAQVELEETKNASAQAQRVWANVAGPAPLPGAVDLSSLRRAAGIRDVEEATAVSVSRHLDMRGLDVARMRLNAEALVLERQRLPTINATVEAVSGGPNQGVQGGLTMAVPIYQRDAQADLVQIQSRVLANDAAKVAIQRELRFELQQHFAKISSLEELITSQSGSLRLLKMRVEDLSKQLEVGLATYDDYLSAQIDANDTELAILSNQNEIRRSHASIILLSGVLID